VPEINGYLAGLRQSQDYVATNRGVFDRAKEAIMAKITENEAAVAALAVTKSGRLGNVSASNLPDLDKARAGRMGVIAAAGSEGQKNQRAHRVTPRLNTVQKI
jgi:hypothetical protein